MKSLTLSLITEAISLGNLQEVKNILEEKDTILTFTEKSEALIHACNLGHTEIAAYLMERGANPKAKGQAAARQAACNGKINTLKLLYSKGCRPDGSHLEAATKNNQVQTCIYLLKEHQLKISHPKYAAHCAGILPDPDFCHELCKHPSVEQEDLNTALVTCARYNKGENAKILMQYEASPEANFHEAFNIAALSKHHDCLEIFLKSPKHKPSLTTLHVAASSDQSSTKKAELVAKYLSNADLKIASLAAKDSKIHIITKNELKKRAQKAAAKIRTHEPEILP